MSNYEIFNKCVIDFKQVYKEVFFNSKKERVHHSHKPYTRSGKSPYPFDKIVGKFAKKICGNERFLENYKLYYQIRDLFK